MAERSFFWKPNIPAWQYEKYQNYRSSSNTKSINQYEKPKQAGIAELATEIGKDIGANLVLLGNYSIIENEILIITKIVNSKTGVTTPLIKKQYNLDAKSAAFDIANDLSEKIFDHLQEDKAKNNRWEKNSHPKI